MLHLRIGNQLEQLSDRLIVDLGRPVNSIFDPEPVIVPGMAVARWLSLRMAQQTGISANIFWQLPADLLWFLFQKILKKTNTFKQTKPLKQKQNNLKTFKHFKTIQRFQRC